MDSLKIEGLRGDTDRLTLYEMFAPWGAILELDSMVQGNGNATAVVKFRCGGLLLSRYYETCAGPRIRGPITA